MLTTRICRPSTMELDGSWLTWERAYRWTGVDLTPLRDELGSELRILTQEPAEAGPELVDVTHYPVRSDLYLAADLAVLDGADDRLDFAVIGKPGAATVLELVQVLYAMRTDPEADRVAGADQLQLADGRAAARLLDALLG